MVDWIFSRGPGPGDELECRDRSGTLHILVRAEQGAIPGTLQVCYCINSTVSTQILDSRVNNSFFIIIMLLLLSASACPGGPDLAYFIASAWSQGLRSGAWGVHSLILKNNDNDLVILFIGDSS